MNPGPYKVEEKTDIEILFTPPFSGTFFQYLQCVTDEGTRVIYLSGSTPDVADQGEIS